jgi:hypothetical protein
MKTIVEIPQTLLDEVRKLASQAGTTLRALVDEGLQRIIAEHRHAGAFRLRKATFMDTGLQVGVAGAPWARIRGMVYDGRGG